MTTIGVLGAGQLGRMLAQAGIPMGLNFRFLSPDSAPPATGYGEIVQADYTDAASLECFGTGLAVATYEFENVALGAIARLEQRGVTVHPGYAALQHARDRLLEKTMFRSHGIATPRFAPVALPLDIDNAASLVGFPAVLKTRQMGYDGKGQRVVNTREEVSMAWNTLKRVPCILEEFVRFHRELSVIGVRSAHGEAVFYPLAENVHRGGILRYTIAPAPGLTPALQAQAEDMARRILEASDLPNLRGGLDYRGVLALELFDCGGKLLANEMAPRVHNSAHWTMDGAATSQFENHLRGILGRPLGPTHALGTTVMLNLIGINPDEPAFLARHPRAMIHIYGKAPRAGRKIGHINIVLRPGEDTAAVIADAPPCDPA